MFRKVTFVVLAAAAILTALTAFSTARTTEAASPTTRTTVPVYSFADGKAVPGASSILRADEAGVTVELYTAGLPVGSDTELWWLVYNAPEQCAAGTEVARCGLADLWNKAAKPSAMYGASQKIPGDLLKYSQEFPPAGSGRAYFLNHRAASERKLSLETWGAPYKDIYVTWRARTPQKGVVIGSGITNPLGAEIHFIVLSCSEGEGPTAEIRSARRHCENKQYAVHQQQTEAPKTACLWTRKGKCIRPDIPS
jgi:hypothetical protein